MHAVLVFLLCFAGPRQPAIEIDGPQTLAVAEYGDYAVRGLSLEQAKAAYVDVWPEAGTTVRPVVTWSGEPLLLFRARTPGQYRLLVAVPVSADRLIVAKKVIQVGTPQPEPQPEPKPEPKPPQPEPQPQQKWQIAVVLETGQLDNLPEGQRSLLASLLVRKEIAARGHHFAGIFDKDSERSAGAQHKGWFDAARGQQLPVLLLAPLSGGTVRAYPLPADVNAFWKLLASPPQSLPLRPSSQPTPRPSTSIYRSSEPIFFPLPIPQGCYGGVCLP